MRIPLRSPLALCALLLLLSGCASVPLTTPSGGSGSGAAATASAPTTRAASASPAIVPPNSATPTAGSRATPQPVLQTPRFTNLIDRIQSGFAMPELDSPLVAQHERWSVRNPEYLNRVFDRGGKYLFHIVEELEARGMPTELALLPIVESAFNPQA